MAVTSASEGGIFRAASGVALNCDARPMVHGVGELVMASLSSHHYAALARPLGDRRDPCQTAQGGVISSLQSIEGFCEQRGEDDPSHSRQGCEDLHVMLLSLSWPVLLRRNEPGGQSIELAMRLPELVIDEPDARGERLDMRGCGLGCSGGDLHRRLAQHVQDMRGVEASDAIALQDLGDRRLSDANCFVGRRRDLPQVEQPLRSEIAFEIEHRRKIAPELFAHAVCKAVALGAKIVGNARPLPQFNDDGIGDGKRSEATQIGAQGRGHHLGVTAVVLGTGQREAVAEAIHLLRVDGVNLEAALDQRLDHGAVRDLDCDMDLGWYAAARRRQPDRHLGETLAAVPENFLADPAAVLVRQENMMALARPIDASIPSSFINHPRSPLKRTSRRNLRRSLYWRSESGLRVRRGLPTGHRSRPIRRGTRPPQVIGSQGAIGCSRRIGSVWEEYAALDRRPRVTLRSATLHFARPAACIPETA